jgi:hypothetical protein
MSALKSGITAIGARLRESSNDEPSPAQSDAPTITERAGVLNKATLDDAYPCMIRRPRPSRYY